MDEIRKAAEAAISSTLSYEEAVGELPGDEVEKVAPRSKVTCFNRDRNGDCLAFSEFTCSKNCSARLPIIEDKIKLLTHLLNYAKSRTDRAELRKELNEAIEVKQASEQGKYENWMSCYYEDRSRGSGGGSSEQDSNRSTSMKALLKDNRPVDVRPTRSQLKEYQAELDKWEEKNGKLPKLGRSGLGRSKVDTYLEEPEDE